MWWLLMLRRIKAYNNIIPFNMCNIWIFLQDSSDAIRQAEKAAAGEAGVRPGGCEGQEGNDGALPVIKTLLGGVLF